MVFVRLQCLPKAPYARRLVMRRLLPLFCFVLMACGSKGSPRLEGKWLGVRVTGTSDGQQEAADEFAHGTVLEFRADAVAIRTPKGVQVGRYKVVREDKGSLVIMTDKDGSDEAHTFSFEDQKTLVWQILPSHAVVLSKQ